MRTVRTLTVGSSTTYMIVPRRSHRHEGSYPELLPDLLGEHGIPAHSMRCGQWYGMVHEAVRKSETFRDLMPDVVIINFGQVERQPNVLPTWLNRHFTTWDLGSRTGSRRYRRVFAPPMWRLARIWQRFGSGLVGRRTHRLSPARFERAMTSLITLLRSDLRCLVIVLDIDPPGPGLESWLPGINERTDRYNDLLRRIAASFSDPDVRLIETSSSVRDFGFETVLPDGMHRSVFGHRLIAQRLTEEIAPWVKANLTEGGEVV